MTEPVGPSRRDLIRAGAWSLPALTAAVVAPAAAASGPDLTHVISITGAMLITPTPATPNNFLLDFSAGSTTFDVSTLFSTPAGDTPCADSLPCTDNGWILQWEATTTVNDVPNHPAFTGNASVTSVTVNNAEWGFDSTCSIRVTAVSITAYPSVSYEIHFVVSDGG